MTKNIEPSNRVTNSIGFSKNLFDKFLTQRHEPDWVTKKRKEAWSSYELLPMPTSKDEIWRRTDIRGLNLDKFALSDFSKPADLIDKYAKLPESIKKAIHGKADYAGLMVSQDSRTIFHELKTVPDGLIFESLETAVQNHRNLLDPYFEKGIPSNDSKFVALSSALWSSSAFIYIPRNVKIELPLYLFQTLSQAGLADFSRLLILADELSEVTIIQYTANTDPAVETLHSGVTELFVKPGSHVRYVDIQDWNKRSWHLSTQRAFVDRDAHLEWIAVGVGSRLAKTDSNTHLREQGSRVDMLGLTLSQGRQHIDYHTLQDHEAPHASSDLLYNSVLRDKARTVFRGMIRVHKEAQKTDAYQRNNNLVLNEDAHADSIPGLEIEANDVRCTHGSTTGEIDMDQIYYLMSRGISRPEAERLIIEGFFETVLQRISSEPVKDTIRELLIERQNIRNSV